MQHDKTHIGLAFKFSYSSIPIGCCRLPVLSLNPSTPHSLAKLSNGDQSRFAINDVFERPITDAFL
jgi:hypothetical protein